LRRRLAALGISEPDHIIMTLTPAGAMLIEIADQLQAAGKGKPN
jgi:hypothetical protein